MALTGRTRQEVIDKIAELLRAELVLVQDLVEGVYTYVPSDPQGLSPIVAVAAVGTRRDGLSARRAQSIHTVAIYIYVLYTHTDGSIDEQEAWNAMNQIEQAVAEVLDTYSRLDEYWYNLEWAGFSSVDIMPLDNQGYLLESVLTQVSVT
jgi:hypothetical protein